MNELNLGTTMSLEGEKACAGIRFCNTAFVSIVVTNPKYLPLALALLVIEFIEHYTLSSEVLNILNSEESKWTFANLLFFDIFDRIVKLNGVKGNLNLNHKLILVSRPLDRTLSAKY